MDAHDTQVPDLTYSRWLKPYLAVWSNDRFQGYEMISRGEHPTARVDVDGKDQTGRGVFIEVEPGRDNFDEGMGRSCPASGNAQGGE